MEPLMKSWNAYRIMNNENASTPFVLFEEGYKAALAQPQLKRLGARLAEMLDEDQWAECEALLLAAGVTPNAVGNSPPRAGE